MVDIPRETSSTKRFLLRGFLAVLVIAAIGAGTYVISQLEPAAPTVERVTVWTGTVKHGDMVREVRGNGKLVPEDIRWVTPDSDGRVEVIPLEPGVTVTPDTVILELSNQELELAVEEAKLNLKSSESELEAKKVEFEQTLLDLQTSEARLEADLVEAELRAQSDRALAEDGLISELQLEVSTVRATELAKLKEIEAKRVEIQRKYSNQLLEVLRAQVDQASALYELKQHQLDSLRVRAGFDGVLEQVLVEEGQQVNVSTNLAKVSDPAKLKAVLRVHQDQVREVRVDQQVELRLRDTDLRGHVGRIDPAVLEGSVNVDVFFDDPLPAGARPDQNLDGDIEIETLVNVLYVNRPAYGQPKSSVSLFKLNEDGTEADRVSVRLGRSSETTIEIVEGLQEGDRIILTKMDDWDDVDRIRLK